MISKEIGKSPFFQLVKEKSSSERFSLAFAGLWSSPKGLLATLIKNKTQRDVLIITGGTREDTLFEDISLFNKISPLEFPVWDTLPGESISPSADLVGKRFETLHHLSMPRQPELILTSLPSLLIHTLPVKKLKEYSLHWVKGSKIAFETIPKILLSLGYSRESLVIDKGQFAVRGGIIDIFPSSSSIPYRVEFFGDTVDELRTFNPMDQKSLKFDQSQKGDGSLRSDHSLFIGPSNECDLLLKETEKATLFDYLSKDFTLIFDDPLTIENDLLRFRKVVGGKHPLLMSFDSWASKTGDINSIFFLPEESSSITLLDKSFNAENIPHPFVSAADLLLQEEISFPQDLEKVVNKSQKTHFFYDSEKTLQTFQNSLGKELLSRCSFHEGNLSNGFVVTDIHTTFISSSEITHRKKIRRQRWRQNFHAPESEFHHLQVGDPVVHYHSGIGIYRGIEKQKNHLGLTSEFLVIEYAQEAKLFVPFSQAHLVNRYIGSHEEEMPHIHELGSKKWQKTKASAQKEIIGYAAELLDLYAKRTLEKGFSYREDSEEMQLFENDFPFVETEDQLKAIQEIKEEMLSSQPMDRLLCGDVGYGKTEVAMRAAFKAVIDGQKQVALLVPTTILAMQHFDSFRERMANYPIRVGVISRFKTARQNQETLKQVQEGNIDILIGTHRILSEDVFFKDLGLIIIDEEQRFGVRAKEHLRKRKVGVDTLTLSATPIPRTLYFSLIQVRKMSLINTPPQDRLPVKTVIASNEDKVIKEAILRELSREGQVFFIHNRVESIEMRAENVSNLVQNAKTAIVHGQMDSEKIDEIFHDFKLGKTDILFATTIIENGVDIPNANTIIIDHADGFGLADLYQLKGRVGRWNRIAYAYFLTAKNKKLSDIAKKRLSALVEAGSFGGGIKIAMRDLEIRGAGEILGTAQSGQISSLGFHLYCKLLKKTIAALKNKKDPVFVETQLELPFDGKIPEDYIFETEIRMELYSRMGEAYSFKELESLLLEMKDRFGKPPEGVLWLIHLARLRVFASVNQFTHLRIKGMMMHASRIWGTKKIEKDLVISKKISTPLEMEQVVVDKLKEAFEPILHVE